MTDVKMTIDDVLALGHVMPVIVIDDAAIIRRRLARSPPSDSHSDSAAEERP